MVCAVVVGSGGLRLDLVDGGRAVESFLQVVLGPSGRRIPLVSNFVVGVGVVVGEGWYLDWTALGCKSSSDIIFA